MSHQSNIVLIGMPGSGKSTLGRRLAKLRGLQFVDADTLIEEAENCPIQQIVNARGVAHLRQIEASILSCLALENHVIATGGSAVYSNDAMTHLGRIGVRLYLQISMQTLTRRVDNSASRGLAKMPQHTLQRLYLERLSLYGRAADVIADNNWPITAVRLDVINKQLDCFINGQP